MHEWLVTIETEKYEGTTDLMDALPRFIDLLEHRVDVPTGLVQAGAVSVTIAAPGADPLDALSTASKHFATAWRKTIDRDLPTPARVQVEHVAREELVPA